MKIGLTELNNKSRKGTYYYIKQKGHKGAYYKYQDGVPLDVYTEYYRYVYTRKKKASLREYKQAFKTRLKDKRVQKRTATTDRVNRYLRKVKKRGRLITKLGKGIGKGEIKDIHNVTESAMHNVKKAMFSKLVLDKELLEIIIKDENLNKLTPRFSYFVKIIGEDGSELAVAQKHNRPIRQIVNELKSATRKGEEVNPGITSPMIEKLKKLEYQGVRIMKHGYMARCQLRVEFAKAK